MADTKTTARIRLTCKCGAEAEFEAFDEKLQNAAIPVDLDALLAAAIASANWTIDGSRFVGGARLAGVCPKCRPPASSSRLE